VQPGRIVAEDNWLERVKEAEVEAAIDEDANAADHKTSIEAADAIWGKMMNASYFLVGSYSLSNCFDSCTIYPGPHQKPLRVDVD